MDVLSISSSSISAGTFLPQRKAKTRKKRNHFFLVQVTLDPCVTLLSRSYILDILAIECLVLFFGCNVQPVYAQQKESQPVVHILCSN